MSHRQALEFMVDGQNKLYKKRIEAAIKQYSDKSLKGETKNESDKSNKYRADFYQTKKSRTKLYGT